MTGTAGAISTQRAETSDNAHTHTGPTHVGGPARPRERLHLFGIRHHGPGSARSVGRALDELRPDIVLIELPADCESLLGWVADAELQPPVALLGYLPADVSQAAFWPLAEFSPEWQAIRWALDHGIVPVPIDTPMSWALGDGAPVVDPALHGDATATGPDEFGADPLQTLAAAAGEPDAERWWDDVVEHRGDGAPAFDAVAEAMTAVRGDRPAPLFHARREAHMRRAIRNALASGGVVAVICGAWHVPALDPARSTVAADAALLKGLSHPKAAITWVPWSDRRLQRRSGYSAGVSNPGWYRHVFRNPGPQGIARFFVDAAAALRAEGLAASPDHLIGASRLADALAVLRERPRAGLGEVLDAATAVMAQSFSTSTTGALPGIIDALTVGDAIGSVPPAAPQVPLARDVTAAQKSARLKPQTARQVIELDLRTPNGLRRSHLLHRLDILGVEWGTIEEGRGARSTFRETWSLEWDPAMAIRLVECASYGTTLVAAASAMVVEQAEAASRLPHAASLVQAALLGDLPDAVNACASALGVLAAHAADVADLIDALLPLARALRYGDVRRSDSAALATVVDEIVVRVTAGLDRAARQLDDDAASAMIERLSGLQGALAMLDHPARQREFPEVLAGLADGRRVHGLVRGRTTRLLHDGGTWSADDVSQRVGRALTPGTPAADGARFVEGFLAGSGTVLVHDTELLDIVDGWISAMPTDTFIDAVALLRRTFGAFEPAERRQLGLLVTGRRREHVTTVGPDLDNERALAGLATVRAMLGLAPAGRPGSDDHEDPA